MELAKDDDKDGREARPLSQGRLRPAHSWHSVGRVEVGSIRTVEFPSRRFGRYVVRSRLGQGGMAEVFLADAHPHRGDPFPVALKLMRKDVPAEAFADEADLMGLLDHPNLVRMLEIGRRPSGGSSSPWSSCSGGTSSG